MWSAQESLPQMALFPSPHHRHNLSHLLDVRGHKCLTGKTTSCPVTPFGENATHVLDPLVCLSILLTARIRPYLSIDCCVRAAGPSAGAISVILVYLTSWGD